MALLGSSGSCVAKRNYIGAGLDVILSQLVARMKAQKGGNLVHIKMWSWMGFEKGNFLERLAWE
jgi:hypothetical protein